MADCEISVIQGDVLEYWFDFGGKLDADNVYFACPLLNITAIMPYSEKHGYCLRMTTQDTIRFKPGIFYFDVTGEKRGQRITYIYKGIFTVEPKPNKDYYITLHVRKGKTFRHTFGVPDGVEFVRFICPVQSFEKPLFFSNQDRGFVLEIKKEELSGMSEMTCDYFIEAKFNDAEHPEILHTGWIDIGR